MTPLTSTLRRPLPSPGRLGPLGRLDRLNPLVLPALVLFAALLRGWHLDSMSIWQDEGLSLYRATQPLTQILSGNIPLGPLVTHDVHPPLYFLLLALWFKLVGAGTWTGKWFSLLASLPTVPLIWALGRRLIGRNREGQAVGLVAAFLAALSPVYLWYSQDIRSYTLAVTLGLMAVYALVRGLDEAGTGAMMDRRRRLTWMGLCAITNGLLVWTHYLGFFLVAFEALVIAAYAVRARRWQVLVPLAAVLVVAIPLVPFGLQRLGLGAERDQHFVPLYIMLEDVLRGFSSGLTANDYWSHVGELWSGVLLIAGLIAVWQCRRRAAMLMAGYLFVPVLALFAITIIKPVYLGVAHIVIESPAFYLSIAGIMIFFIHVAVSSNKFKYPSLGQVKDLKDLRLHWQFLRFSFAVVWSTQLVLAMLDADYNFYHTEAFQKDDLRALAQYVEARAVPGDVLAVSDPVLTLAFSHLVTRVPVVVLPEWQANGLEDARSAADQLQPILNRGRLWYMRPNRDLKAWLDEHALAMDEHAFHGRSIPVRVVAYERKPVAPTQDLPPRAAWTAELGDLRLLGFAPNPSTLVAGQAARVGLAWQVASEGLPDYKVAVKLLDAAGNDFAQGDHEPYYGTYPTSKWPFGELTYSAQDLAVSPAAPPGKYRLAIVVYNPATGDTFPPSGPFVMGEVRVARPAQPLPDRSVAAAHALDAAGGGLELVGVDMPGLGGGQSAGAGGSTEAGGAGESARAGIGASTGTEAAGESARASEPTGKSPGLVAMAAGEPLALAVWLRVLEDRPPGARLRGELLDAWGRVVGSGEAAIVPEGADEVAELRRGDLREVRLVLDTPLEAGRYGLRVRVLDVEGRTLWLHEGWLPLRAAWLARLTLAGRARQTAVPAIPHPLGAVVGGTAELLGYDVPAGTRAPGGQLPVTLYWRSVARTKSNYQVTVQLLPLSHAGVVNAGGDETPASEGTPVPGAPSTAGGIDTPSGPPVAQHDGVPADGTRPTGGWAVGEVITDRHVLKLPADIAPGTYLLIAALYNPAIAGQPRPPVKQGAALRDYVLLQRIELQP